MASSKSGTLVSEAAYLQIALDDKNTAWELHNGRLREKPAMTCDHNWTMVKLGFFFGRQLDWSAFQIRVNAGRVARPTTTYYIPDVFVLPTKLTESFRGRADLLEAYAVPLPLVVEVWSRSTGNYDVNEKLDEYRRRGDLEIWRLHPYERTLTAWRRQPDGSYEEAFFQGGVVRLAALPDVEIDLDALFAL